MRGGLNHLGQVPAAPEHRQVVGVRNPSRGDRRTSARPPLRPVLRAVAPARRSAAGNAAVLEATPTRAPTAACGGCLRIAYVRRVG